MDMHPLRLVVGHLVVQLGFSWCHLVRMLKRDTRIGCCFLLLPQTVIKSLDDACTPFMCSNLPNILEGFIGPGVKAFYTLVLQFTLE